MARRVSVGDDFEGEIKLIEAKRKANVDRVRTWIVLTLLVGGVIALIVVASVGFLNDNFDGLQTVWNVTGPMLGAVIAYYFGSRAENDGKGCEK